MTSRPVHALRHFGAILIALAVFAPQTAIGQEQIVPSAPADIQPLLIGERISNSQVFDVDGKAHNLREIISKKPTVLIVFRGGWCPFCSKQLAQVGKSIEAFKQLGWQVVGLSPDPPEKLKEATQRLELKHALFSDKSGAVIRSMGLAYTPDASAFFGKEAKMKKWAEAQERTQNTKSPVLPVPAVFLVHRSGLVVYEYINVKIKVRASGVVLLSAAKVYREK